MKLFQTLAHYQFICWAICGASSSLLPVIILTTPLGTSELEITSAKEIAHNGSFSETIARHVFPERITGIMEDIKPNKEFSSGATIPTTPIGSKIVKLK